MRITRWDQRVSTQETNDVLIKVASALAERISDATARGLLTASLTSFDVPFLCSYSPDYVSLSTYDCLLIRQITAFFSKRADLEIPGVDRREAAIKGFVASERLCAETNALFEMERRGVFSFPLGVTEKFFSAARRIAFILGECPRICDLKPRFGPGATTTIPKRMASARRKLGQAFACSESLIPYLPEVLEELQNWLPEGGSTEWQRLYERALTRNEWESVPSDVCFASVVCEYTVVQVPVEIHTGQLAFVPKSAKTDRSVVVEPVLNTMFQIGVGDFIADRLRRAGIDIRDQSRNQRLAREGSLTGALATLDLSSASDTISTALVAELVPPDWLELLTALRSGTVRCGDYEVPMEKFSSMGNGFTFPLETLIFYALALSCVDVEDHSHVSVYGDDIIVPVYAVPALLELFRSAGFIVNEAKSFWTGSFRESCGADYKSGIDIRPSYVKDALTGQDVFRLRNFFFLAGDEETANLFLSVIDPSLRRWGPAGFGDGHLIGDRPLKAHNRASGWSGYVFETYTWLPRRDFSVLPGDRVYPSYTIYSRETTQQNPGKDLARWARAFTAPSRGSDKHSAHGYLGVSVPGVEGCRLIKIYTLC